MPTLPKWFRFRFSLLTLMLVVTACCLLLGWWTNSAQRQKRAVAWVEEQGGLVHYDWEFDGGYVDKSRVLEANWLRDWLGIDYFHKVNEVDFLFNTKTSDFSPLADLKNLKRLYLKGTQISDLSPLSELNNLEWLFLENTQVSDLSPLADLNNLNFIDVRRTQVSLEEIIKLKRALPNLAVKR